MGDALVEIAADLCVVRTPWDYFERAEEFLDWIERAPMPVVNPASVLRWNHHKGYLAALQECGAARIPATAMVAADDRPADADALLERVTAERAVPEAGDLRRCVPDGRARARGGRALDGRASRRLPRPGLRGQGRGGGVVAHVLRRRLRPRPQDRGEGRLPGAGGARRPRARRAAVLGADHGCGEDLRGTAELLGLDRPLVYARVDLVEVPTDRRS